MSKERPQSNTQNSVRWMNRIRFLFCMIFLLVCCLPLLGSLAGIETPNLERRTLAPRPALLTGQALNLDYTSQFDAYFSDHFTFRTQFIAGWHQLNQLLLLQSGNERVIVGKNGWLFFRDTLDDYLGVNRLDAVALARLDHLLHLQQSWLARRDIAWILLIAPNKHSIYPQMMPDHLQPIHTDGNLDLLKPNLDNNHYLDLEGLLAAAASQTGEPIYHRTDSHWNNYGARLATQAILAAASPAVSGLKLETPAEAPYQLVRDWTGDLAVMMNPAGPEPDWQFRYEAEARYQYDKAPRSMEDILIGTRSNTGSGTLLMFRDSFANALIPLLSESFGRAVYSRATPQDYGLVGTEQPDLVILEVVERNLSVLLEKPPRLPADALPADAPILPEIHSGQPLTLSGEDLSLKVSKSDSWLKISGLWLDDSLQQSVDRVLVGLPSPAENGSTDQGLSVLDFFEACPIADDLDLDWQNNGGFTLYLEPGRWLAGSQPLQLYLHLDNRWLQAVMDVTLP